MGMAAIHKRFFILLSILLLFPSAIVGCGPSAGEIEVVDYSPLSGDIWPVSTPEEQGIDPDLVAELYYNASQLETVYSLLVFMNGYLIAEDYYHNSSPVL
jgi:hypothetical protein